MLFGVFGSVAKLHEESSAIVKQTDIVRVSLVVGYLEQVVIHQFAIAAELCRVT